MDKDTIIFRLLAEGGTIGNGLILEKEKLVF
jgi:hypothetical protein